MFYKTPATSYALLFVFKASTPLIKSDHSFKVLAETSYRIPDAELMSIGVKLLIERLGDTFHGYYRGRTPAIVMLSSLI